MAVSMAKPGDTVTIDVTELQPLDVIVGCEELGKVHHVREVSASYGTDNAPGVGIRVYFDNGDNDLFGAPQRIEVKRGTTYPNLA